MPRRKKEQLKYTVTFRASEQANEILEELLNTGIFTDRTSLLNYLILVYGKHLLEVIKSGKLSLIAELSLKEGKSD